MQDRTKKKKGKKEIKVQDLKAKNDVKGGASENQRIGHGSNVPPPC
jgi:hypothetical protein